jgi:hypothetical protein
MRSLRRIPSGQHRARLEIAPPHHGDTMNILDRVDAVLVGLCPCGGTPRPGSPYCGYDCEPDRTTDRYSELAAWYVTARRALASDGAIPPPPA